MKKILFFCNTNMQLINAIQMKRTYFRDNDIKTYKVDLVFTDHSQNADVIVERLKKEKIFNRVRKAQTKKYTYEQNIIKDVGDVLSLNFGENRKYKSLLWEDNLDYDILFFYKVDMLVYTMFDRCKKNNSKLECTYYEEGIHSYMDVVPHHLAGRIKLTEMIREIFFKESIRNYISQFFCYYPELVPKEYELKCEKIPLLSREDTEIKRLLNSIFDYVPQNISQKYIYFTTALDIEGFGVNEDKLVEKIAKLVGYDNLLVKMHPRDTRTVYEDKGFTVSRVSSIPWEVIQLNHDFSNHIFLSISSGSIINATAMLGDNITGYFLYPLINKRNKKFNSVPELQMENLLENLQKIGICNKFNLIHNDEELEQILKIQ